MRKNLAHLALVMALAVAPAMAQSLFFPARNDFETGFTSAFSLTGAGTRVAVGDFDNDGELDAVATLEIGAVPFGDPTVQEAIFVYRGDGRGLFEDNPTVLTLPLNSFAGDVVTGEFTGDSNLDIAVAVEDVDGGVGPGGDGGVLIFAGDGSLGFTLDSTLTGQVAEPGLTGLVAGNIDGSGDDDLVLINSASNTFTVFLSSGSYSGTTVSSGVCTGPVAVALGNLDTQIRPDLAIACDPITGDPDSVQIWLNNGSGGFLTHINPSPTGSLNDPRAIVIAPLNDDLFNDVAVANSHLSAVAPAGTITLLKGDGSGNLTGFTADNLPVGETPRSIDAADIDGDGDLDLLVANWDTEDISVLEATIAGTGPTSQPSYTETFFAAGYQVFDSLWADLDGDGTPDVVAANANEATGTLSSYLGGGDDLVNRAIRYAPNTPGQDLINVPNALAAADWNADDADGFAVANALGDSVSIFDATPGDSEPFALRQQLNFNVDDFPFDVLAADLDGDDDQDLLVLLSPDIGNGQVRIFTNNGIGTFTAAGGVNTGALPWTMLLADFNNDGEDDLVVSNLLDHTATVYQGSTTGAGFSNPFTFVTTGDGTLVDCSSNNVNDPQDVDCLPTGLAASDFDGDGNLDLAVSNFGDAFTGGTVEIFSGDGNFGFTHVLELQTEDPLALPGTSWVNHETLRAGDLDGDGLDDLVAIGLAPDDYVSVWLNTSTSGNFVLTGSSQTPFLLPALDVATPEAPRNAVLEDLNGDGNLDLMVAGVASNNASVMLGEGDGSFDGTAARTQAFGVAKEPTAIAYGDFDGDGLGDLLAAGARTDDISLSPSGFLRRSDLDSSGRVDGFDLALLSRLVVTSQGDPAYEFYLDIDMDGEIGVMDLPILALAFGTVF